MSGTKFDGVRRATEDDIDALLEFVPMVLAETSVLPLSGAKVRSLVDRCARNTGGAIAGIIDSFDGGIDASVGLAFTESDTSDEPFIAAVWCGLHPNVRKMPPKPDDPRAHYGRRLFEFAKWCHASLEDAAGAPILVRFDLLTRDMLMPKMGLYQRNLTQIGASFAFGAAGEFRPQVVKEVAEIAA